MRASSLSNPAIISLLNRYFVPAYALNQEYRDGGKAPPEERAEKTRIYREALTAKLPAGTVCVYLLSPAGKVVDSLVVSDASKPERLRAMLEGAIAKMNLTSGEPILKPSPQSAPPACDPDALVLHLTARYLQRQGDELVRLQPVLGSERSGQWASLPSENWIVLARAEWSKWLPAGSVRVGTRWDLDKEVTAKLFNHFYPPTENTNNATNRLDQQTLKATVISLEAGVARVRLEGQLRMKHPFYHKDDSNRVEASVVGYLDFVPSEQKIQQLRLVTNTARYGPEGKNGQIFGVAVRSVK